MLQCTGSCRAFGLLEELNCVGDLLGSLIWRYTVRNHPVWCLLQEAASVTTLRTKLKMSVRYTLTSKSFLGSWLEIPPTPLHLYGQWQRFLYIHKVTAVLHGCCSEVWSRMFCWRVCTSVSYCAFIRMTMVYVASLPGPSLVSVFLNLWDCTCLLMTF